METLSDFSNYGAKNVDIAVYGEDIPGPDLGTSIVGRSGTSQATAIITGVAALYGTHLPEFDAAQIKCAILESARHVVGMGDKATSEGLLNFDDGFALLGSCTPSDQCSEDFTGMQALTGSTDNSRMLKTNLGIESAEVLINQSHHTYDASLGTTLQPGFEVQAGTQFQILSSGCQD
jgi:subtilisin family serine protease